MLTTLRSEWLEAAIDPAHGGEVVALRDRRSGESLLASTPWTPSDPRPGDLSEDDWVASYRGGWQLLTPNAGDPCEVGGVRHGFHGRASNDPWMLEEVSDCSARLRWRGHGLEVMRAYELAGATIAATTRWEAVDGSVPMLHVEHLALGAAFLDPEIELSLPALCDGSPARTERLPLDRAAASFAAIGELAVGEVEFVNRARGLRGRLKWDVQQLPYLWLWHESRASGGPWAHRSEILGIEPAATGQPDGLGRAIETGDVTWVEPGRPVERRVTLCIEPDGDTGA